MKAELQVAASRGEVLDPMCAAVEASCICHLMPGHDGPHECECGGMWHYEGDDFYADKLPGLFGVVA